jgi:hypothetical protein
MLNKLSDDALTLLMLAVPVMILLTFVALINTGVIL